MRLLPLNMFKPSSNFRIDHSKAVLLLWILFVSCISCLSLSYCLVCSCSLEVTCWEVADLLALSCVMDSCVFVTFPYGVLDQVWYLIVSNPDLCLFPYLVPLVCEDETHDVQQNNFSPNEIHLVKWDFNRFDRIYIVY